MRPLAVPLALLTLLVIFLPTRTASAWPDRTEVQLQKLEMLYQEARKRRFQPGDVMDDLESSCNDFVNTWNGKVPASTLATARAYRLRCWLTEARVREVLTESKELLAVEGLAENDRNKVLYYQGSAAVSDDNEELARESLDALRKAESPVALGLQGTIANKWSAVKKGELPPQWTLPRIATEENAEPGETLSLESLRGKYVLLDFWATWCGPCRSIMASDLAPMHKKWADDERFELVSVGTNWRNDTPEKQADFAKKQDYHWTKVFDSDGWVTATYGVRGIPTLTFIDPDGKVIAHGNAREVLKAVKKTLGELEG